MTKLEWRVGPSDLSLAEENSGGLSTGKMEPQPLNVKRIWLVDKKHKKKLRRATKKKKEKAAAQAAQTKIKKQIGMFNRLPQSCSSCGAVFPKTREAHMTWRVVVRNEKQQVRLFCPDCQQKAKELVENNNEV